MIRLAHTSLLPGGPGLWMLVLAGVLFALGVYLFVTKGPPRTLLLMVLASIAITIGSVGLPEQAPDIHIAIEAPADGATVPADEEVEIRVALSGAELSSSSSGSGHLHVLVDERVVSMTGTVVTAVTLDPGPHTIEAEFVSAGHAPLSPRVRATVDVIARAES